jgi:ADP-ribose pyrophosphatase
LKIWKRLDSKTIFKNKFWSYVLDHYAIGDSIKGEYHYVHTPGSTLVIPVLEDDTFILIKQYRYLNQKISIEFPCGGVLEGLAREANALKELREETGYTANTLSKVGEFSPFTGAADELCSVFIGRNLEKSPLPADITEEFEILYLSKDEIQELIAKNIIWDGLSLAAWSLAQHALSKSNEID